MKATLNINDTLLARAKALASRQRTRVTRLIEEGLRRRLRVNAIPKRAIPMFQTRGGLAARVNLLSNKALLQAVESDAGRQRAGDFLRN